MPGDSDGEIPACKPPVDQPANRRAIKVAPGSPGLPRTNSVIRMIGAFGKFPLNPVASAAARGRAGVFDAGGRCPPGVQAPRRRVDSGAQAPRRLLA